MRPLHITPSEYFEWRLGRLAFALGSPWKLVNFDSGDRYFRLGLAFYWRLNP